MVRPKGTAKTDAEGNPLPTPVASGTPERVPNLPPGTVGPKRLRRGEGPESKAPRASPPADAPDHTAYRDEYRLDIPSAGFEGPLDLLLHLIQQHELDILDIPIAFVTERFLKYLAVMRSLSIDVASEYLVMAATLAHIKSKMLLPTMPEGQDDGLPGDEDEDPRAELVRRLLDYQKYKAAAAELAERGTLGKDIFGRGSSEAVPQGPAPFATLGVFSLLEAFEKILSRTNVKLDHEVIFDRISITDRMLELNDKLVARRAMRFEDLVTEPGRTPTRFDIVITFLAILEMAKLRMIKLYQSDPLAPIHVELAGSDGEDPGAEGGEAAPVVEA